MGLQQAIRRAVSSVILNVAPLRHLFWRIAFEERMLHFLLGHDIFRVRLKEEEDLWDRLKVLLVTEPVLSRLKGEPDLQRAMLSDETFIDRLASTPEALRKILERSEAFEWLRGDERLQNRLHEAGFTVDESTQRHWALERVFSDTTAVQRVLENEQAVIEALRGASPLRTRLVVTAIGLESDPVAFVKGVIDRSRLLELLQSDPALLSELFTGNAFYGFLSERPDAFEKLALSEMGQKLILTNDRILNRLVVHPRTIKAVAANEAALSGVLKRGESLRSILTDTSLLESVLQHRRAVDALLGDNDRIRDMLGDNRTLAALWRDASLLGRVLSHHRALAHAAGDEDFLNALLKEPRAAKYLCAHPLLRSELMKRREVLYEVLRDARSLADLRTRRMLDAHVGFWNTWEDVRKAVGHPPLSEGELDHVMAQLDRPQETTGAILDLLCEDNTVEILGSRLRFKERRTLWTLIQEIFLDEQYYFESKRERPYIIDCGAHLGFSILYFKRLYPNARITAFEPLEENFAIALENVAANSLGGVELLPYALAAEEGSKAFYVPAEDSMGGSLTTRRVSSGEAVRETRVSCRRLSEYLSEPVDFLKLDIEGAEDEVLIEAGDMLDNVDSLMIEFHDSSNLPRGRLERILALLTAQGFRFQVSKSVTFRRSTHVRPMTHLSDLHSSLIWATKRANACDSGPSDSRVPTEDSEA